MSELPNEIISKIMSYLPILDNKRKLLNQGIRNTYKILALIDIYSEYFNTNPNQKPSKEIIACSIGWIYNDLSFFLNNCTSPSQLMMESYKEILYKVSKQHISNFEELEQYENFNQRTVTNLLFNHVPYLSECTLSNFITYVRNLYSM
jgi:hypothetical protein